MKANVSSIVLDHYRTLTVGQGRRVSVSDIIVFVLVPIIVAAVVIKEGTILADGAATATIAFYGVFVALLLNFQVAIFSIFTRSWKSSADPIQNNHKAHKKSLRDALIRELNANISYHVLVAVAGIISSLVLVYFLDIGVYGTSVQMALFVHFVLGFLLIVKRSYLLFRQEYRMH